MPAQKRAKTFNTSVISFALLIGIFLVKFFIWDEYVINNSAVAAVDGLEGQPGVYHVISGNQEIAIKPSEEGFNVYAVSKGVWGWSVTDELALTEIKNQPFEIVEGTLQFKKKKSIYLVLVLDKDTQFDTDVAYSANSAHSFESARLRKWNSFLPV